MNKPYIFSYMMMSLDGRIDCKMTESLNGDEYYPILESLNIKNNINGKTTSLIEISSSKEKFKSNTYTKIDKETFYKVPSSKDYSIILDSKGELYYDSKEANYLIITSLNTSKEYLDYLKENNISYIVTGKDKIDLNKSLDILYNEFDVKECLLTGGGNINGGFLKENLIDDILILIGPGIDGRKNMTSVFDGLSSDSKVTQLKLKNVKSYSSGAVLLKYSVTK